MRNIAIQQFTCTVLDFTEESYLDPICPISLLLDHIDQPLYYFLVFTNHNPCIYGISGEYFHIENVLARVRCHSSCVWQWLAGVGAGAPREGLFVQDEVDSTSRVATFVRADRLEKIIMLANIRDGKKWVI